MSQTLPRATGILSQYCADKSHARSLSGLIAIRAQAHLFAFSPPRLASARVVASVWLSRPTRIALRLTVYGPRRMRPTDDCFPSLCQRAPAPRRFPIHRDRVASTAVIRREGHFTMPSALRRATHLLSPRDVFFPMTRCVTEPLVPLSPYGEEWRRLRTRHALRWAETASSALPVKGRRGLRSEVPSLDKCVSPAPGRHF